MSLMLHVCLTNLVRCKPIPIIFEIQAMLLDQIQVMLPRHPSRSSIIRAFTPDRSPGRRGRYTSNRLDFDSQVQAEGRPASGFFSGRVRQIWPAGKLERVFLAVRGIFEAQERPNLPQ